MKDAIRILILDNSFTFGGAINSLCHLLRALDKKRCVPILVSAQPREHLTKNFICTWYHFVPRLPWVNNRVYRKLLALPIFRYHFFRGILNLMRSAYWLVFIIIPESLKYYRLGRRHQVDLIHLNNIFGSQPAGILAAKLLGIPCIAHLRDFEVIHPLTRFYAKLIDHHVAISGAIRDNLLQIGVPADRISLVYDAIDLAEFSTDLDTDYLFEEFSLAPNQPRFGIFGRVVKWKGIREFIHAVSNVIKAVPHAVAFIVGDCSDGDPVFSDEMKKLAQDLDIENQLVFTGYRQDVPAFMKVMDVIVHASNRPEPFGMVLIEGMAMSRPVVATSSGGPLDIVVDGETGFLVRSYDYKTMAEKIIALLNDPELAGAMGGKGKARVLQNFTKERYAADVQRVYENVIQLKQK